MKSSLLSLALLCAGSVAGAVNLGGTAVAVSDLAPDTRLSVWAVNPAGQPLQPLADTELTGNFKLGWPDNAPAAALQFPVNERTAWPGLVDFAGSSVPLQATELKFFTYQDINKNGQRDGSEALREVRLSSGKGSELFVVWTSQAASVKGGGGYQADLKAGWNLLKVEMRKGIKVSPFGDALLRLDLSR